MKKETQVRYLLNDGQCRAIARELKSFGYPNVTLDDVVKAADDVAFGREPLNVYGVFIRSAVDELEEARPDIKPTPAAKG